jgi:hypothetical protein
MVLVTPLLDLLLSQGGYARSRRHARSLSIRFVLKGCLREPAERFPCRHLFSDAIFGTAMN